MSFSRPATAAIAICTARLRTASGVLSSADTGSAGGHAGYQFRFFQQYLRRFMERRLVRRQQRRRSGHVLHGPGIGCPQHRHYPVPQEIAGNIVLFIGSVLHMGNVMRLCIPRQLRPGHPQ